MPSEQVKIPEIFGIIWDTFFMFSHNLTWIFMRFIFKRSNWLPIRWFKKLFSWSMDVLKLRREKKCDSAYKLDKKLLNPGAITRRGEDILSYSWHVCFWWAGRFFLWYVREMKAVLLYKSLSLSQPVRQLSSNTSWLSTLFYGLW